MEECLISRGVLVFHTNISKMKKLIIIVIFFIFSSCNAYKDSETAVIKPKNKIYSYNKNFLNKIYKIQKQENIMPMSTLKLFNEMRQDCIEKLKVMNKNFADYDTVFILESYDMQFAGIDGRIWSRDRVLDFSYQNRINYYSVKHNCISSENGKDLAYKLVEHWDTTEIKKINEKYIILGGSTCYATRIIKTKKNKNLIIDCFTFQQLPNELPF